MKVGREKEREGREKGEGKTVTQSREAIYEIQRDRPREGQVKEGA